MSTTRMPSSPTRTLGRLDWPRGQRDTIVPTRAYLDEVITWFAARARRVAVILGGGG